MRKKSKLTILLFAVLFATAPLAQNRAAAAPGDRQGSKRTRST